MATVLADLVADLAQIELAVAAAPTGLSAEVGEPVLLDLQEAGGGAAPGDVVLGIGVDASSPDAVRLVRRLGQTQVAALVLKRTVDPPAELCLAANDSGVAVLTVPRSASWGQLYTLIRTVVATGGGREGSRRTPLGDLFALADAVAAMVGGAVTIEDPGSRVLAYSNLEQPIDEARQESILGRQVMPSWIQRLNEAGVFRRLWQEDGVVEIGDFGIPGMRRRIATAVRAGGEVVGSIWVVEGQRPFDADDKAALRGAAELTAIHLLHHRSHEDLDRRRRSEALKSVLDGLGSPSSFGAALDLDQSTPVTVVALVPDAEDSVDAEVRSQRAADFLSLSFEAYRRRAAVVAMRGTVYVLLPDPTPDLDRLAGHIESIVARAGQALRVEFRAGIGSTVPGLAQAAQSRHEAELAAKALVGDRRGRVVGHIGAVRSRVVLDRLRELAEQLPELRIGKLQLLEEQDRQQGIPYTETVRAYLDAFGDITLAAQSLNVHPNTFRYRLKRLREIADLDLDDPDERLVLHLQSRFGR